MSNRLLYRRIWEIADFRISCNNLFGIEGAICPLVALVATNSAYNVSNRNPFYLLYYITVPSDVNDRV